MARRTASDFLRRIISKVSNQDDLRWLYRDDDDSEHTRIMPDSEIPDEPPPGPSQASQPRSKRFRRHAASSPASSFEQQYPQSGYQQQGYQQPGYPQQEYQQPTPYVQPGYQPPMPYQPAPAYPTPPPKRPKKKHRVRKTIGTLFVFWLLYLIAVPLIAFVRTSTVDSAASDLADQPGNAVLLVGSDGRGDLSAEDRRRLKTGSTSGQRTDTMMLLYTAPNGKSVILGFPRDSYVEIPGHGKNKLNAAYALGGAPLLIQTVEHNTGIKVDGYLEIGMLGLVNVVDAVGGIEICPNQAINDRDSHLDIPAGCQQADGVTALGYARMRKQDKRGDLGRMERQREVISQIVKEVMHPLTFINPVRYWNVAMGASGALARTPETGIGAMTGAGVGFISGWAGNGTSLTVPIADANARTKAGSSVIWDEDAANEIFRAIQRGDVAAIEEHQ